MLTMAIILISYYSIANEQASKNENKNESETKLHKIVVLSEIYPPYQIMSKEGELSGMSADKVKALFLQAKLDYHVEIYPWARAYQIALTHPNILIFSLLRTPLREDLFQWVVPLCALNFSFYRKKSRPDIIVNSMKDAKQYLIAAQNGQASFQYLLHIGFEEGKNLSTSYNNDNFIQMMFYDRVELIVLSHSFVNSLILRNEPHINEIEAIYNIEYLQKNLYLAASLNTSKVVINKLQKAHRQLLSSFNDVCQK